MAHRDGDPDHVEAETPADQDEAVIVVPRRPDSSASGSFPWIMMITPAVMGIGLVVVTGSTYGLLFAACGPLLALITIIDQTVQRRRRIREADAQFERDLDACERLIAARLDRERRRRLQQHGRLQDHLGGDAGVSWDAGWTTGGAIDVALGTTVVPSGIRLDVPAGDQSRRAADVIRRAKRLEGIPYRQALNSCAVVGAPELVVQAALGLIVDLVARCPGEATIVLQGAGIARHVSAEILRSGLGTAGFVRIVQTTETGGATGTLTGHAGAVERFPSMQASAPAAFTLILSTERHEVPTSAEAILEIRTRTDAAVVCGGPTVKVQPQLATPGDVQRWAAIVLATRRRGEGTAHAHAAIPDECDLSSLLGQAPPERYRTGSSHIAAPIGVGASGPIWVDLVSDGPHAVIGGTTGSGKSELLRAWIAGVAVRYPATHVAFLCIDFKGGATFDAIADLPHCVGVITDLDGDEATRVLAGLRAELRRREHALRRLGVRDIGALEHGTLERLVVVVDEFQALMEEHRELHDAFADLAARGRSLGMHVILCAQRPAGAARESLLSNCTIRLSLRVTSDADSHTLIGTGDAAKLPAEPRGRALVAVGDDVHLVQIARVSDDLIERTRQRRTQELERAGRTRPTPPWLPPLPTSLRMHELLTRAATVSPAAVPIALIDDPEHQRQPVFALDVRGGRHLALLGMAGSGKTTALRAIHALVQRTGTHAIWVPADLEGAWDAIEAVNARTSRDPLVLFIDDIDERAATFGEEHRNAWLEQIRDIAKRGASHAITVVASASRAGGEAGPVLALATQTCRLRFPSRHEFILTGGEATDFTAHLPAGRGILDGRCLQFPHEATHPPEWADPCDPRILDPHAFATSGAAVITSRPTAWFARLTRLGIDVQPVPKPGAAPVFDGAMTVGDVEEWRQSFGSLGRFASRAPIVFDDLPTVLTRGLLPGEPILAPVADPERTVLVREPSRDVRRYAWCLADGAYDEESTAMRVGTSAPIRSAPTGTP